MEDHQKGPAAMWPAEAYNRDHRLQGWWPSRAAWAKPPPSTMICHACCAKKYRTGKSTVQNYNNDIGLPVTILARAMPDDAKVAGAGDGHEPFLAKCVSSPPLACPDTALITNIGTMHIENLGSREGILKAKLEILEGLHPRRNGHPQRRRTPFVESSGETRVPRPCTSALRTRTATSGAWILS